MVVSAIFTRDMNRASDAARDTGASHAFSSTETGSLGGRRVTASVADGICATARSLLGRVADTVQCLSGPVRRVCKEVSEQARGIQGLFTQAACSHGGRLDGTRKHTLAVTRDLCAHLLSKTDDTAATAGLFRVPPDVAKLALAVKTINRGTCPDVSQTHPRVCASIVSKVMRQIASVSLNDLRAAAAQTLNLAPDCRVADIASALSGLDVEEQVDFNAALIARMHGNMHKSLRGNQEALTLAKEVLQSLSAIYNSASTDTGRSFNQQSMATSFNLVRDKPAGDILAFMKEVELSQPMIWTAIATLQKDDITHL